MVGILGANSVSGGYEISNSLRFNDGDSPYLSFTTDTDGNDKIATFSAWIKRGSNFANQQNIFTSFPETERSHLLFTPTNDQLHFQAYTGGSATTNLITNRAFRDPSAWYHIVLAFDTTQGTDTNRIKIYVNGQQETSFATETYPSQNTTLSFNTNGRPFYIGTYNTSAYFPDGYMSEINWIDGTQKAASDFGEVDDNGVWIPKKYAGSYSTNGFYLQFKQTGTGQNSSGIGADTSGNDNHYAVTNLTAVDVSPDTPTNNFATMNPLDAGSEVLLSQGNLGVNWNGVTGHAINSTIAVSKGKWYVEMRRSSVSNAIGLIRANQTGVGTSWVGATVYGAGGSYAYVPTGNKRTNGSDDSYGDSFAHGDRLGIAFDADNGALYFYKNGTIQNSGTAAFTGISGTYHFSNSYYAGTNTTGNDNIAHVNFGGDGTFGQTEGATQKTNADANGYGHFYYAVPSGYYSLCTKNLAEFG